MAQQTSDRAPEGSGAATALAQERTATPAAPIELAPGDHRVGWRTGARIVFIGTSWLLVAGLVIQVFLAGLGVFDSPERFELHASFGFALMALPMIMLLSGLAGVLGRRLVGLAALMFGLFFVQSMLVSVRADLPPIAALHPLNGFVILFTSIVVARGSLRLARHHRGADHGPETVTA
jgi:hypothetical protein